MNPCSIRRARSTAALLLVAAILLPSTAPGAGAREGRSYHVEEFHATLQVRENGTVDVLERIRFRFDGSFEGIYRRIPVRYRTPGAFDRSIYLDVERISDESGAELRYRESRDGAYRKLKVWVPGARDASRTVAIRYRVAGALGFFGEEEAEEFSTAHDELYWNVTGDEWEVPIERASARVELPAGVTGIRTDGFTGPYGSRDRAVEIERLDGDVLVRATRELGPREGLTVAVGWDAGVVRRPGALRKAGLFLRANWIVVIPLLVTGLMGWLWHTRGRDPTIRSTTPRYEPPGDLAPAELGTLIDGRLHTRDVTAILVDLAVRGYVKIEEIEKNPLVEFFTGADYRFHRVADPSEWSGLRSYERTMLEGLFGAGGRKGSVELSELRNDFYEHLDDIRDGVFDRLMERGYYVRRPDRVRKLYLIAAAVVLALALPVASVTGSTLGSLSPTSIAVALAGSAVPLAGFGWFMPARTRKGARKLEEVLGFEEFLDRVEEDRFRRMITSPDRFEAYLPHAIALGVDATWARAFEELVTEPPDWYVTHTGSGFRTTSFATSLEQLSSRAGNTFSSSPRSSGGSGFGGGGFSGGGVGGGGGGAF